MSAVSCVKENDRPFALPVALRKGKHVTLKLWVFKIVKDDFEVCVEGYKNVQEGVETNLKCWHSTAISEALSATCLRTHSGTLYTLYGCMDRDAAKGLGYPSSLINQFMNGFPKNWRDLLLEYHNQRAQSSTTNTSVWYERPSRVQQSGLRSAHNSFQRPAQKAGRRSSLALAQRIDKYEQERLINQLNTESQELGFLPPTAAGHVSILNSTKRQSMLPNRLSLMPSVLEQNDGPEENDCGEVKEGQPADKTPLKQSKQKRPPAMESPNFSPITKRSPSNRILRSATPQSSDAPSDRVETDNQNKPNGESEPGVSDVIPEINEDEMENGVSEQNENLKAIAEQQSIAAELADIENEVEKREHKKQTEASGTPKGHMSTSSAAGKARRRASRLTRSAVKDALHYATLREKQHSRLEGDPHLDATALDPQSTTMNIQQASTTTNSPHHNGSSRARTPESVSGRRSAARGSANTAQTQASAAQQQTQTQATPNAAIMILMHRQSAQRRSTPRRLAQQAALRSPVPSRALKFSGSPAPHEQQEAPVPLPVVEESVTRNTPLNTSTPTSSRRRSTRLSRGAATNTQSVSPSITSAVNALVSVVGDQQTQNAQQLEPDTANMHQSMANADLSQKVQALPIQHSSLDLAHSANVSPKANVELPSALPIPNEQFGLDVNLDQSAPVTPNSNEPPTPRVTRSAKKQLIERRLTCVNLSTDSLLPDSSVSDYGSNDTTVDDGKTTGGVEAMVDSYACDPTGTGQENSVSSVDTVSPASSASRSRSKSLGRSLNNTTLIDSPQQQPINVLHRNQPLVGGTVEKTAVAVVHDNQENEHDSVEHDNCSSIDSGLESPPKPKATLTNWLVKIVNEPFAVLVEGFKLDTPTHCWCTTSITHRVNAHLLQTTSGSVYAIRGPMDKETARLSGYPDLLIDQFEDGFPVRWMELLRAFWNNRRQAALFELSRWDEPVPVHNANNHNNTTLNNQTLGLEARINQYELKHNHRQVQVDKEVQEQLAVIEEETRKEPQEDKGEPELKVTERLERRLVDSYAAVYADDGDSSEDDVEDEIIDDEQIAQQTHRRPVHHVASKWDTPPVMTRPAQAQTVACTSAVVPNTKNGTSKAQPMDEQIEVLGQGIPEPVRPKISVCDDFELEAKAANEVINTGVPAKKRAAIEQLGELLVANPVTAVTNTRLAQSTMTERNQAKQPLPPSPAPAPAAFKVPTMPAPKNRNRRSGSVNSNVSLNSTQSNVSSASKKKVRAPLIQTDIQIQLQQKLSDAGCDDRFKATRSGRVSKPVLDSGSLQTVTYDAHGNVVRMADPVTLNCMQRPSFSLANLSTALNCSNMSGVKQVERSLNTSSSSSSSHTAKKRRRSTNQRRAQLVDYSSSDSDGAGLISSDDEPERDRWYDDQMLDTPRTKRRKRVFKEYESLCGDEDGLSDDDDDDIMHQSSLHKWNRNKRRIDSPKRGRSKQQQPSGRAAPKHKATILLDAKPTKSKKAPKSTASKTKSVASQKTKEKKVAVRKSTKSKTAVTTEDAESNSSKASNRSSVAASSVSSVSTKTTKSVHKKKTPTAAVNHRWNLADTKRLQIALRAAMPQTDSDWEKVSTSLANGKSAAQCRKRANDYLGYDIELEREQDRMFAAQNERQEQQGLYQSTSNQSTSQWRANASGFVRTTTERIRVVEQTMTSHNMTNQVHDDDDDLFNDPTANASSMRVQMPSLARISADDSLLSAMFTPTNVRPAPNRRRGEGARSRTGAATPMLMATPQSTYNDGDNDEQLAHDYTAVNIAHLVDNMADKTREQKARYAQQLQQNNRAGTSTNQRRMPVSPPTPLANRRKGGKTGKKGDLSQSFGAKKLVKQLKEQKGRQQRLKQLQEREDEEEEGERDDYFEEEDEDILSDD